MLRNREFRIRMHKIDNENIEKSPIDYEETTHVFEDPEQINEIAQDFVKKTAIVIGTTIVAVKIVSSICDIAVNLSKPKE